jgi:hypothetical protein
MARRGRLVHPALPNQPMLSYMSINPTLKLAMPRSKVANCFKSFNVMLHHLI